MKHGSDGWHCLKTVPWRKTFDEAQADLNKLAHDRKWRVWKEEANGMDQRQGAVAGELRMVSLLP